LKQKISVQDTRIDRNVEEITLDAAARRAGAGVGSKVRKKKAGDDLTNVFQ